MAVYGYPDVGRFGLGHSLLAWARCVVWCQSTGAAMLAPIWLRLRIGPYLRAERDKRNYALMFHSGSCITGLQRWQLLLTAQRHMAGVALPDQLTGKTTGQSGDQLLVFRNALADNEARYFHQVVGHAALLRTQLLAITRPRFHPAPWPSDHVAIHVRRGDFSAPTSSHTANVGGHNVRLPLDWYADRLAALRSALGRILPAVVYSDGSDTELAPLLRNENIARSPRQSAVSDLLAMGQATAVIASGSGFSLWGAFLGEAPRISYPGQMLASIYTEQEKEIESAMGDALPSGLVEHLLRRLKTTG